MIPELIYMLCALTCLGCAILLWRAYRRSGQPLLMWSALCFAILAAANVLLFSDIVMHSEGNFLVVRTGLNLVAALVLLYGLIFKSR